MKNSTHKAKVTAWRLQVMDACNMEYSIKTGKTCSEIVYKGELETTLVSFLVDKAIELEINAF